MINSDLRNAERIFNKDRKELIDLFSSVVTQPVLECDFALTITDTVDTLQWDKTVSEFKNSRIVIQDIKFPDLGVTFQQNPSLFGVVTSSISTNAIPISFVLPTNVEYGIFKELYLNQFSNGLLKIGANKRKKLVISLLGVKPDGLTETELPILSVSDIRIASIIPELNRRGTNLMQFRTTVFFNSYQLMTI